MICVTVDVATARKLVLSDEIGALSGLLEMKSPGFCNVLDQIRAALGETPEANQLFVRYVDGEPVTVRELDVDGKPVREWKASTL